MGGKSKGGGLYESWLSEFVINVMLQTFHAFFLMFILLMLSQITGEQTADQTKSLLPTDGIVAMISIVGMMAIIKFEKLIKKLFGIKDGLSGDMRGAGMKMLMGLNAAKGLYDTTAAPVKKWNQARKDVNKTFEAAKKVDPTLKKGKYSDIYKETKSKKDTNISPAAISNTNEVYQNAVIDQPNNETTTAVYKNGPEGKVKVGTVKVRSKETEDDTVAAVRTTGPDEGSAAYYLSLDRKEKEEEKNKKAIENYNDAVRNRRVAKRDTLWNSTTMVASMGIGLGAVDEWHEASQVANIVNMPLAAATTKYVEHREDKVAARETGDKKHLEGSISKAISDGFKEKYKNKEGHVKAGKLTLDVVTAPIVIPAKILGSAVIGEVNLPKKRNLNIGEADM